MRDWSPFVLGERVEKLKALTDPEGLLDRMRVGAFAELQAREAFLWAAERFPEAPESLRRTWRELAAEEDRHLGMILARMKELGGGPADKPVSDALWRSLMDCRTWTEFAEFMRKSEERGRAAEQRYHEKLKGTDPKTAELFREIAEDEERHIRSAAAA
jgi:uncharacterized ferritin-like protein (DUF455 family)